MLDERACHVALVRKAGRHGRLRQRGAPADESACDFRALLQQPRERRDAMDLLEAPQQLVLAQP